MNLAQWTAAMLALGMTLGWALTVVVDRFVNPWRGRHRM